MKSSNLIEYHKNIDRGICKVCGTLKGYLANDINYFCYNCEGYELLNYKEAKLLINRNKRRLRDEFRKIAVNSDIFYCLKVFLSLGENYDIDQPVDRIIKSESNDKQRLIKIDLRSIALANIGVKWLLEDSLEHLPETVNWNDIYCVNLLNLLITWLRWNNKEKLSDIHYNLGFFISKEGNILFYYTQQFDFYSVSLRKFHIISQIEDIDEKVVEKVLNVHRSLQENPKKLEKYIMDEYPVLISTVLNSYYTDEILRPFSFDNLLDKDNKIMTEFLSHCSPDLRELLVENKRKFPELILALLENLYSFYNNKRSVSKENITKNGFVIVRDFNKLTEEIIQGNIPIPPFKEYIITSCRNFHNYPFIVEFNGNFIISPSRMWIGYRLLHYALHKDRINNELARKYEKESMLEIEKRLIKHGVVIVGKGIKPKKHGNFEIDLIGYYKDYLLLVECKGFHPSPFFMMRKNRRYNDQFKDKLKRINRMKYWIFEKLNNTRVKREKISIYAYDDYNKKPSELIFPMKYHKIDQSKILYLYITQIKEYHEENRDDIIQVWYGDL